MSRTGDRARKTPDPWFVRRGLNVRPYSVEGWRVTIVYLMLVLVAAFVVFAGEPSPLAVAIWAAFNFGSAIVFAIWSWRIAASPGEVEGSGPGLLGTLKRWYHVREGYWFAPKMFGLGATPVTWQGWALTIGFVALLLAAMRFIPGDVARITVAAALVLGFCVIAARKTDGGWRWRWGPDD